MDYIIIILCVFVLVRICRYILPQKIKQVKDNTATNKDKAIIGVAIFDIAFIMYALVIKLYPILM